MLCYVLSFKELFVTLIMKPPEGNLNYLFVLAGNIMPGAASEAKFCFLKKNSFSRDILSKEKLLGFYPLQKTPRNDFFHVIAHVISIAQCSKTVVTCYHKFK